MICESCGTIFEPKHPRGRFCSDRCRGVTWRMRREQELSAALLEMEHAMNKIRRVLARDAEDSP